MSPYKKNLAVGVTVLVALALLAWMILRFSDAPFKMFAKPQMRVYFKTVSAEGLGEGSPVYYLGVSVGRVTKIRRSTDPNEVNVIIETTLDVDPPLPANVEGAIRSQIFGGGSSVSLVRVPPKKQFTGGAETQPFIDAARVVDQKDVPPVGRLEPEATLEAKFLGTDLFPREQFTELAISLTRTSDEFRETARQLRQAELVPKIAAAVDTLREQIARAGGIIDKAEHAVGSIDKLVGDEQIHADIRQTLANFRETSNSAKGTGEDLARLAKKVESRVDETADNANRLLKTANTSVEQVSKELAGRLEQLASVLQQIDAASRKLNEGKGAAAMLLNDPLLYENLLDVSKELKLSVQGFRRVIEQWEQEGVPFKLR